MTADDTPIRSGSAPSRTRSLWLLGMLILLLVPACTTLKETFRIEEKAEVNAPAEQLIMKGMDEFNVGKYFLAIEYFNEILDRYPFSPQAPLAELKAADSNYYMERYEEALVGYNDFEERHPTNEAIAYVMYQKGMCHYKRIGRIDRDISGAVNSIQAFQELLRAYPVSPYTDEAKARIKAATEFLVNHEYSVVEFYLRTGKYGPAAVRLRYILAMYPDSAVAPDARELLDRIEAGNPPKSGIGSWFKDLSLPDWMSFSNFESEAKPSE